MQLSIVIVSYNVKHFLEQCLLSVRSALKGIDGEVIIVDNNSEDESVAYLQPFFPEYSFIALQENLGFAKACNAGWRLAKGEFIVFLNPDTIIAEDCFSQCLQFMQQTPDAGALGMRMIDGNGSFLKESKRGFPTPLTSLYRFSGLSSVFSKSKKFARYYSGHLAENKIHKVEVLSGAFMFIRNEVLEKTGGFDERFFMYGEDIDLSYRLQQTGYNNYYLPQPPLIHFKGESTRKKDIRYVSMFYNAMSVFVQKHYPGKSAVGLRFFLKLAIGLKAVFSAVGNFIKNLWLPIMDALIILCSFYLAKQIWINFIKPGIHYNDHLLMTIIPGFTLVFLLVGYYAGLYSKKYKAINLAGAAVAGMLVVLVLYSLLPEQYRFSRGIIITGPLLAFIIMWLFRKMSVFAGLMQEEKGNSIVADILVAGNNMEYINAVSIAGEQQVMGRVSTSAETNGVVGTLEELSEIYKKTHFSQLIFCGGTLTYKAMIETVERLNLPVKIKYFAPGAHSIIGSDSSYKAGETITQRLQPNIATPYYRRLKRLTDVAVAILGVLLFPITLLLVRRPMGFFSNCFAVIARKKTWVGYNCSMADIGGLPEIRQPVMGNNGVSNQYQQILPLQSRQAADEKYAQEYTPLLDLKLIKRNFKSLGG